MLRQDTSLQTLPNTLKQRKIHLMDDLKLAGSFFLWLLSAWILLRLAFLLLGIEIDWDGN